jgi:hypothetical protein
MRGTLFLLLTCGLLLAQSGCSLVLPTVSYQPVIRNPFPQLSKVAVAPFFNQSDEPTVDGREIAIAYFTELQKVPGFEVVPVGVVEEAMIMHRVDLAGPGEARRLAQLLGVDAVVIGAVTDYTPYYPPRMGLRVEWYTANPGFHEIPAGYGLPWHTPEEEFIPDSLVYEAKMAYAKAQLANQSPDCNAMTTPLPAPALNAPAQPTPPQEHETYELESEENIEEEEVETEGSEALRASSEPWNKLRLVQAEEELPPAKPVPAEASDESSPAGETSVSRDASVLGGTTATTELTWSDDSCFAPSLPQGERPPCLPHNGPVLLHTRLYRGTDPEVTEALKGYVYHRDDARFGGWEAYLQRSGDFVSFCCHMHISEMLSARGGSRKTRVLWRWQESR